VALRISAALGTLSVELIEFVVVNNNNVLAPGLILLDIP
jgi:hypothetical protein